MHDAPPGTLDRDRALRDAATRTFDVIVIGGGINGAGIARDAALRGLSVLLLEADDFGFGTTWRSTKLIHGGLRYLEHREWRLVFEGLRERAVLLRTAPHLVRPLPFLLPVYHHGRYGPWTLRAGMLMYDLLSAGKRLPRHRALSAEHVVALEPATRGSPLRGGFTYYDAQVSLPERLCLENILAAREAGAVAFNRLAVTAPRTVEGHVTGVEARDRECNRVHAFRGRVVINAAGPWVDTVLGRAGTDTSLLGGTRGSHIVVRLGDAGPRHAIYAEAGSDGRPFFIIPWRERHLIGTTDIRFEGDPAAVRPEDFEIDYLLREAGRVLPAAPPRAADVLYAFAGVRPLPRTRDGRAGAITRRHFIVSHARDGFDGLFSIIGGKLTSYRRLAEQVVDLIVRRLDLKPAPSATATMPLVPGAALAAAGQGARYLAEVYGARAAKVLALAAINPALAVPLCPHGPEIGAQVAHAARFEQARTLGDVLLRRTPAGWNACRGLDAAPAAVAILARELGWDNQRAEREIAAYRREVDGTLVPGAAAVS
jgi:glycerol-3-phosphate dehydrogenase